MTGIDMPLAASECLAFYLTVLSIDRCSEPINNTFLKPK